MNDLIVGLFAVWLATNTPAAVSNLVAQTTGASVDTTAVTDPVERRYLALLAADDAAQAEVDEWIKASESKGAALTKTEKEELANRVEARLKEIDRAYEGFLRQHPKHVRALLAYGSFLNDTQRELEAVAQWEKARKIDPKNPATWNNLANYYGHRGPVTRAFEYYAKAIELEPNEPVYYQNFGTTVFLFRRDATEFFKITEQQVFDKALDLYAKALKLAPNDFLLAQDVAQTYYGIKPPRFEDAIRSWEYALKLAADAVQREGVELHLARTKIQAGRFDEARKHLAAVSHPDYATLKGRIERTLREKSGTPAGTTVPSPPPPLPASSSK